jgi:hypothetical protein
MTADARLSAEPPNALPPQCPMPHAPCPMPHAPCPMPHAPLPIIKQPLLERLAQSLLPQVVQLQLNQLPPNPPKFETRYG